MQVKEMPQPKDYARAVAALVATLPVERAAEVYDFAYFLTSQPVSPPPITITDDDWLNDTEEQLREEDALWEATYARHREKFTTLAQTARAEIAASTTRPMFDEQGEFAL
ncbi:MAG: hypothetical protein AB1791_19085 [Chloroflexota bacterium]